MLTVRTVSERLDCCTKTVYGLIRTGELPAHRLTGRHGGRWRIAPEDFDTFLRRRRRAARKAA